MPLGLLSIAAYLKKYGGYQEIDLLDANCRDIYKELRQTDIVGIGAVTQDIGEAVRFARFIKGKYKIPIVLGGVHISTYRQLPDSCFDAGVIGEGEETMLELMVLDSFSKVNLLKIKGICFNDEGKTVFTAPREPLMPLDKIPIPDREIADSGFYLTPRQIIPYYAGRSATMITSRGCPFHCPFCSTRTFWGKFRAFSAGRVVEEMELLIGKYKAEIIHIFDDLFIADTKRLNEIHDLVLKKGINRKAKFMCLARSDLLDEPIMKILKEMNVVIMGIGMESGCEDILGYLKNHTVTVQQNRRAIALAAKYKIPIMGVFMAGNPHETEEQLLETYDFIKDYRNSPFLSPLTYISVPFPGTEFWDFAKAKGLRVDEFDRLVMDIPFKLDELKKAITLTDIPLERFFQITRLFLKEDAYAAIKKHLFLSSSLLGLLKAYIYAILTEKNLFKGIKEVNKMRRGFSAAVKPRSFIKKFKNKILIDNV